MALKKSSGRYAGTSAEERSGVRRASLLRAALDIIGTQGMTAATVSAISERAGLIRRYFYESFDDLEALLVSLYDEVLQDGVSAVLRAIETADDDARSKARTAISAFIEFIAADAGKAQLALLYAQGHPALLGRYRETEILFINVISSQWRAFYCLSSDSSNFFDFNVRMLVGGTIATLIAWLENPSVVAQSVMIERITDFYLMVGDRVARHERSAEERKS